MNNNSYQMIQSIKEARGVKESICPSPISPTQSLLATCKSPSRRPTILSLLQCKVLPSENRFSSSTFISHLTNNKKQNENTEKLKKQKQKKNQVRYTNR